MATGDTYVAGFFPAGTSQSNVKFRTLTPLEATALEQALKKDAVDFYFSAWVSFMDAIRGTQSQCFTWATVKLYYSVFYALRAALALDKYCIFHVRRSAFSIRATPGSAPVPSVDRGTHQTVMNTFSREYPGHFLNSQLIDLKEPLDWLLEMREHANYQQARFAEPESGPEFDRLIAIGIRKALATYISDGSPLYVFDPDHAIVAFPLRVLQITGGELLAASVPLGLSSEEIAFLSTLASDRSGKFATLVQEMKRLGLLT